MAQSDGEFSNGLRHRRERWKLPQDGADDDVAFYHVHDEGDPGPPHPLTCWTGSVLQQGRYIGSDYRCRSGTQHIIT